jgi:hypothetical protein
VVLLSLTGAVVAGADTLGLGLDPASGNEPAPGFLGALPLPLAYGAAIAAFLTFATLVFPRARRAESRNGIMTVEVLPPSASRELGRAFRAALAIMLTVFALATVRAVPLPAGGDPMPGVSAGTLAPFQVAVADVSPSLQAVYREVQNGLAETARMRTTIGRWPEVSTLVAEGVPPFATPPAVRAVYAWSLYADGAGVSYLGVPARGSTAPPILLAISDPATQPDALGETHRLGDGSTIRISVWFRPAGVAAAPPTGVVVRPEQERWMQIVPPAGAKAQR